MERLDKPPLQASYVIYNILFVYYLVWSAYQLRAVGRCAICALSLADVSRLIPSPSNSNQAIATPGWSGVVAPLLIALQLGRILISFTISNVACLIK